MSIPSLTASTAATIGIPSTGAHSETVRNLKQLGTTRCARSLLYLILSPRCEIIVTIDFRPWLHLVYSLLFLLALLLK
jgi:hypothetical protein